MLVAIPLTLSGLGAALLLGRDVILPLASACLQACSEHPWLMGLARGLAGLPIALLTMGLVAGSVVLARQLVCTRRLVRQVESRQSSPPRTLLRLATGAGVAGDRLTYVLDPAPYAFCYGLASPRVCISSGMVRTLNKRELQAVLLHEGFHARRRDPLKVLVSRVLGVALFMLPTAAELRDRYLVRKELDADTQVLRRLSPQPLAAALLKLATSGSRQPVAELAAAAVGPFNVTGERIRHLADPDRRLHPISARRVAASFAVVLLLLLSSAASVFAADRSLPASGNCCGSTTLCDTAVAGSHTTAR